MPGRFSSLGPPKELPTIVGRGLTLRGLDCALSMPGTTPGESLLSTSSVEPLADSPETNIEIVKVTEAPRRMSN
jgi:hypothetical protein